MCWTTCVGQHIILETVNNWTRWMVLQLCFKYTFQLSKILEVESPLEIKFKKNSMAHQ